MANTPIGALRRQRPVEPDRALHDLGARLDRLERDLGSFLAGGPIPPAPPSRVARGSQWLVVTGALLIVAAMALAVF